MVRIPFSLLPPALLEKTSSLFMGPADLLLNFFPFLKLNLLQAELSISARGYLAQCLAATTTLFIFFGAVLTLLFAKQGNYILGIFVALAFSCIVFMQQLYYPKLIAARRIKGIERNLLGALRTILIQVRSGVPLFNVLVAISTEQYGEVSVEFKRAVRKINSGLPEVDVLEQLGQENPSIYFRRALWQIADGMKAGAPIESVLKEAIETLSREQLLEIEHYGSTLNPLAMFYMLIAIILPALGMTFLIILSSFIALDEFAAQMIFWGLYGMVLFFQVMFLGMIRSRRPTLIN